MLPVKLRGDQDVKSGAFAQFAMEVDAGGVPILPELKAQAVGVPSNGHAQNRQAKNGQAQNGHAQNGGKKRKADRISAE
jgi:hypothetical protein